MKEEALECQRCGREIKRQADAYASDSPWRREFMCRACYREWRDSHVPFPDAKPDVEPCIVCGRKFAWIGGIGARRPRLHICSAACARERRNQARRVGRAERECAECGKAFVPKRADALVCSAACRQRAYRERMSLRYAP